MEAYLDLGLCIGTTCILLAGLRQIQRYKVDLPLFVGINYLSATLVGLIFFPQAFAHVFAHPILALLATLHGFSFFILFLIMGWMTQKVGLGYMTIVAKMSLAIPVLFSWMYYGDEMTWVHFLGVGLALGAILLVNLGERGKGKAGGQEEEKASERDSEMVGGQGKKKASERDRKTVAGQGKKKANERGKPWLIAVLSVVLFIGSGASDALFRVLKQEYSGMADSREYIIVLFSMAAVASIPVFVYKAVRKTHALNAATVVAGLVMGIPNYFSIVFLAASLKHFDGTVFYPVNNTAILLVMAVVGAVAYKERLNRWKVVGLLLALTAVILLGR